MTLTPKSTVDGRHRVTLVAFLLVLAVLTWGTYTMVAPYLLAVLMGLILATLFRPLHLRLMQRMGKNIAAVAVTFALAALVVVPVALFVLTATNQAIELARKILNDPSWNLNQLSEHVANWKPVHALVGDVAELEKKGRDALGNVASAAPAVLFKFFGGLPEFVLQALLGLVSCYFFLVDGNRFAAWLADKVPLDPEVRSSISNSFRDTAGSTIVATICAACCQTTIISTGYFVLGMPGALLAAGGTFIMAWVPLIGSSPIWLGAALYFVIQGSPWKGLAMIGFGILTGISDNIVYPLVLRGRGQLHPLVSLVAIFGGIHLFGIFGVFVGPILAAIFISALDIWPVVAERFGFQRAASLISLGSGQNLAATEN